MIIAFAGKKGTGKTTAAEYFEKRGFKLINFADSLKHQLMSLGLTREQVYGSLKEVAPDGCLLTPRDLMQTVGDHMKKKYGDDIFIKLLGSEIKQGNYVIGDLRFPNEYAFLKSLGATVVIIERDTNKDSFSSHNSETSIDEIPRQGNIVLTNKGTLAEFYTQIEQVYAKLTLFNEVNRSDAVIMLKDP